METPELPPWAQRVANDNRSCGLKFLTVKTVDSSDVSEELTRIQLPVEANDMLRIYLTPKESSIVDSTEEGGPLGMLNNGLRVFVFVPSKRLELELTSWDGFYIATNIKGSDWLKYLMNLEAGDKVGIWIFRRPETGSDKDMPCFIFHKLE